MATPSAAAILLGRESTAPKTAAIIDFRARPNALFVTPELAGALQAGGLGEVAAALPRALRPACDARLLIPAYRPILRGLTPFELVAHLPGAGAIPPCSIGATITPDGVVAYLVLCDELYDRDGSPYSDANGDEFPDNDIRFARLSLAAAELALAGVDRWRPDVLHLNDWPTALAAGYLRWRGGRTPTVMTIHNLAHQGLFDPARLRDLDIPESAFTINGVEFYGRISFLKAGVFYADHVTTVSATYADQIARPEFGCGLEGLLAGRAREGRLSGIRNGVDANWDPRADHRIPYRFDPRRWKERYADYVRGAFGLGVSSGPLFAFVARLVHQKGFDLVLEASESIVARGGQLVIVGRGEPQAERAAMEIAGRHREAIAAHIGFDANEARAVFAGADFLLMPSRYEPCGLSQMYAQRFGALPIAHDTGGLAETIDSGRTGFLFDRLDVAGFGDAIDTAFAVFETPLEFRAMRRAAMAKEFSWADSATAYAALYRKLSAASGAPPALRLVRPASERFVPGPVELAAPARRPPAPSALVARLRGLAACASA